MKTYQDLLDAGRDERARMEFIRTAIRAHRSSEAFRQAQDAALYYAGENPTIGRYEKILYDLQGRAHRDLYTANHKLASRFFGLAVDQEVAYLLGNGVTFEREETRRRLGATFDQDMMELATDALIAGVAFAFFNLDHLETFRLTEFVPLYDEEDGALKAGVRFWQVAADKPLRATLYELDGYTEYVQRPGEEMETLRPKRDYIQHERSGGVDGTTIYAGENYPGFPIVPLKNGRFGRSALCGRRNTVDALDLATSNMVNNVDEGNLIYWVLTNCGGMDDLDDVKFIDRIRTLHVAHADGDNGAKAEAHTIEAPYSGTNITIDMLKKKLYEDFQAFDSSAVSASNQTATAIEACYVPLDLKADIFEPCVTRCIQGILRLAGIKDRPVYTRNRIVNRNEEIQSVLLGASYLDDEYITRKILTILGDADQADEVLRRRDAQDMRRFGGESGVTDDARAG